MKHIFQSTIKLLSCILFLSCIFHPLIVLSNCDQIRNGNFANRSNEWIGSINDEQGVEANVTFTNNNASFQITGVGEKPWYISLEQRGVQIQEGESYQIRFRAKAAIERSITVAVSKVGNRYLTHSKSQNNINLSKEWAVYEYAFNADITDYKARLVFMLGAETGDVFIDDVSMEKWNCCSPAGTPCNDNDACTINDKEDGNCNCEGDLTTNNQILNGDFSTGINYWMETIETDKGAMANLTSKNGEAHFEIEQTGLQNWNIALQQRSLSIEADQHYKISFKAKASEAREINVKISDVGGIFDTYFSQDVELTDSLQAYTFEYMAPITDPEIRIIFNMGLDTPNVTIDDVSFEEYNCEPCEDYLEVCDDGDPCTINDYYDASCNCVSYTIKEQIITNGNFSDQLAGWSYSIIGDSGAIATANFDDRQAHFKIENDGTQNWHIGLEQRGISFIEGESYTIKFRVLSNTKRSFNFKISDDSGNFKTYFNDDLPLTNFWMYYSYNFTPDFTDYSTRIIFNMGIDTMKNDNSEIFIDDVSIAKSDCSDFVQVNSSDYMALATFYKQNCKADCELDWYLSRPVHTWEGIEIENGRVVALNVASKGLSGNMATLSLPELKKLDLSNNNFDGLSADFSNLIQLQYLDISKNQLSFEAVEKNFSTISGLEHFQYSPQYVGYEETYVWQEGNTYWLKLPEELSYLSSNTSLQWKQNDELILGSNSTRHLIQKLNQSTIGTYTLHISNESRVPDLEIILQPRNVLMDGYDIHGQPVYNNEVMVLFDEEAERDAFFTKYLNPPYNGIISFQCDCKRLLYLFRFESSEAAAKVLLEIDRGPELVNIRGEPDGDPNTVIELEEMEANSQKWKWPNSDQTDLKDIVHVYLLDSGLDESNLKSTTFLMEDAPLNGCYENSTSGYSFVTKQHKISINYQDDHGHGTYGYHAITGEDNSLNYIKIVPIKIFNEKGESSLFHFICGLFHSIDNNADIINVSGGFKGVNSSILETALQIAQQKGIFITTSAGNDAIDIDQSHQFPAYYAGQFYQKAKLDESGNFILDMEGNTVSDNVAYDNIISVASLNAENKLSEFSNFGANSVTLSAYGENLIGYTLNGQPALYSGTSMATFYTSHELARELAKDKSRDYKKVWKDFEANKLILNKSMLDKTITGKQINVTLQKLQLRNSHIAELQKPLVIFPNPSSGHVNIDLNCFDYTYETDIEIKVYNTTGIEIFNQKIDCLRSLQFNINVLNKGTYLIKLIGSNWSRHGKMVVN